MRNPVKEQTVAILLDAFLDQCAGKEQAAATGGQLYEDGTRGYCFVARACGPRSWTVLVTDRETGSPVELDGLLLGYVGLEYLCHPVHATPGWCEVRRPFA